MATGGGTGWHVREAPEPLPGKCPPPPCPAPFTVSTEGAGRSSVRWGGASRRSLWGLGSSIPLGGRVCRKTWGLEDRDALRLSFCAALKTTAAVLCFATSALQLPMFFDSEAQLFPGSGYRGCGCCFPQASSSPRQWRAHPLRHPHESLPTARAGPEATTKERSCALGVGARVRVCVCVNACGHVVARTFLWARAHVLVGACVCVCGEGTRVQECVRASVGTHT